MGKPRIYLDNSVIGGCFDEEFEAWSNALMTEFEEGRLVPALSPLVETEAKRKGSPPQVRRQYDWIVQQDAEILFISEDVEQLAEAFAKREIVSAQYYDDMLHVATAVVGAVDALVSWNMKHIVHPQKIPQFTEVSQQLGYAPLRIVTPKEVVSYG